jgi:hypothetical protein
MEPHMVTTPAIPALRRQKEGGREGGRKEGRREEEGREEEGREGGK